MLSVNLFDYDHVWNFFLVKNDKSLLSHQKIHSKKLLALTKGISNVGHGPKAVFSNFLKYKLTKKGESLLSKGLPVAIPPNRIEYTDFMLPFLFSARIFLSQPFTNHRTAGEVGGHFFNSLLPLRPASQTLRH